MSRIRTIDQLQEAIVSDFNWRVKEISDIRLSIKTATDQTKGTLLRSSLPMLYAHWEGHVSFSSRSYLQYICQKRKSYALLKKPFLVNALVGQFNRLSSRFLTLQEKIEFIEIYETSQDKLMSSVDERLVSTRSNLNYAVLEEICSMLSLEFDPFKDQADFIDKILLDRRNNIAHGQHVTIAQEDFVNISDQVLGLMRSFRNGVENSAIADGYLR